MDGVPEHFVFASVMFVLLIGQNCCFQEVISNDLFPIMIVSVFQAIAKLKELCFVLNLKHFNRIMEFVKSAMMEQLNSAVQMSYGPMRRTQDIFVCQVSHLVGILFMRQFAYPRVIEGACSQLVKVIVGFFCFSASDWAEIVMICAVSTICYLKLEL